MQVYLNGDFLPADKAGISIFDGGFLFGDGVYTTLRVYRGIARDLPEHWRRLRQHAQALEIPLDLELEDLVRITERLVADNRLQDHDGRLRITVSRGGTPANPLPLRNLELLHPTVLATVSPVAPEIAVWQRSGIGALVLGPVYARTHFPELKTLNGLTTVLALRQAARMDCQEAFLTTGDGLILEGAVSNLFMVRGEELFTPENRGGFLPGITRRRIISLAKELGIPCRATRLHRRDLASAGEIFCASSVREILPVVRIDNQDVGNGRPGPLTAKILAAYHRAMGASAGNDTA